MAIARLLREGLGFRLTPEELGRTSHGKILAGGERMMLVVGGEVKWVF